MGRISSFLSLFKALAAILGIISLFLAVPVRIFLPELTESVISLLILGLLLLSAYVIGARKNISAFISSKQARYGFNTLIMILLFLAVIILANILGIIKQHRFDITASGKFTLAPQTINVVKGFKVPVTVLCFIPNESAFEAFKIRVRNLLEEYSFFNKKFRFHFIDPDSKPALAKQYKVKTNGTIIFESGGRQKAVLEPTEQNFTNALLEVSGTQAKKIYFLIGNGEHDVNNQDQDGYSQARMGLIRDLYQVETLNLTLNNEIPPDCAVLVMAGTKKVLPAETVKAVRAYLAKSGKLLMLIDPNPPEEMKEILLDWGLTVNEGRVMDPGAYVAPDMAVPAVFQGQYPPVVITSGLDTTYFPEAVSFDLTKELKSILDTMKKEEEVKAIWPLKPVQLQNLVILPAILSTPESWLERSGKEANRLEKMRSPQALGAMVIASSPLTKESTTFQPEKKDKLTRLIVFGDSDFASNSHIRNGGNGDLFLNAVNWLAEEEHLISIRPKSYTFRRLLVNQNELRFIRYSSLGLLPLLILILGGIIWWKKR
jgi:ABC-type uncharacterized transport system involved in gliding motility auxiliary subunit